MHTCRYHLSYWKDQQLGDPVFINAAIQIVGNIRWFHWEKCWDLMGFYMDIYI